MPIPPHIQARRAALAETAKETKAVLPGILQQLPHLQAAESEVLHLADLPELEPSACPRFELASSSAAAAAAATATAIPHSSPQKKKKGKKVYGTLVKVLNQDTFDAAIMMAESLAQQQQPTTTTTTTTAAAAAAEADEAPERNQRVAVMNLASEKQPGGGWLTGAVAQEEALCYRSSLSLSLHRSLYPLPQLAAIYTRDVVIIRSSMASGHRLLHPATPPAALPVVSVISVAGVRKPELREVPEPPPSSAASAGAGARSGAGSGSDSRGAVVFKYAADRDLTKGKMRLALRAAAGAGHELLVLGALGCGAFRNPPREVARCWLEVLEEPEFAGGWFREVWFAVLDGRREGNFEVFESLLGGREVGRVEAPGVD